MSQTDKTTLSLVAGIGGMHYTAWVGQIGLEASITESTKVDLSMGSAFNLQTAGPILSYKHISSSDSGNYHGLFGVSAITQASWADYATVSEAINHSYLGGTVDIGMANGTDSWRFQLSTGAIGDNQNFYPLLIMGVQGILDLI